MKDRIKEMYDKEAEVYDSTRTFFEKKWFSRRERECIARILKERFIVLTLACGTGRHHGFILSKGCELVGVDLSVEMLKAAKRKKGQAYLILADAENLPFKAEVFDVITCSRAFKLFPHKIQSLKESYRCLRRGGMIAITEGVTDLIVVKLALKLNILRRDSYQRGSKGLRSLFKKAGFKIINQKCVICAFDILYSHVPDFMLNVINFIENRSGTGRYIMLIGRKP